MSLTVCVTRKRSCVYWQLRMRVWGWKDSQIKHDWLEESLGKSMLGYKMCVHEHT